MIVDKILNYLSTEGKEIEQSILDESAKLLVNSFNRQFGVKQESDRVLRLSSIGKCLRQQAYNILGYEYKGKEIDSRSKMVFFQGDMTELAIIQLAKIAGCEIMACGSEQENIELMGVKGHPDGILINEEIDWRPGKWKIKYKYLVEVKSMSSYSYAEFQEGNIEESYLYQINAYLEALGLEKCVMVALNKDSGVLGERIITKDIQIVAKIKENINILNNLMTLPLPERPYSPNEKGFLPWNCNYCKFYITCWPNAEKVLVGKSYKLKVRNETSIP